ncbi:HD domain-containing protein [Desulforamulus ferrireducens]|uniref:Phosphohydrolase n=1 Tax=Desulforamulus ferrireducens TaxID=1833852 RepID=A0A1S6J0C1_9FIRM|nr:HD domain-containing protein [Desulforamulus ferrireducens]AQS60474.1 phosphohydrolase [Desulforamulus ferrireducens]
MYRDKVISEMKKVFQAVPYGIDHTLKVLKDAEEIMEGENISPDQRELIALVAILHDIGAVEAQRKHGSMAASYQEKEGPDVARQILQGVGYDPIRTERICYIIGHHHTPAKIDGIDFQIQWEADLLANLEHMEIKNDPDKLRKYIEDNFKTSTGKRIAMERFM